jgi:hypothetical protein
MTRTLATLALLLAFAFAIGVVAGGDFGTSTTPLGIDLMRTVPRR